MNNRVWHSGPPPHVGWWNASLAQNLDSWRWWNGEHWSVGAGDYHPDYVAFQLANILCPDEFQSKVRWTTYWPENARVPRIDPRGDK